MNYAKDMFIEAFSNRFANNIELLEYLIDHNIIEEKTVEKWAIIQSYPVLRTEMSRGDAIREIQKNSRLSVIRVRTIVNKELDSFRAQHLHRK
jgi:hypothetical protein